MKHGAVVSQFEREFAAYVGARFALAASNGTVTLQAALVALGVTDGMRVGVPPLTMSATTIAALNVGAGVAFCDVDPRTWLCDWQAVRGAPAVTIGVSLYGLHWRAPEGHLAIDDAAQTLRPHNSGAAFTSYSLQRSKILNTGEGGMLVTDDESLAEAARSYLSLGYAMRADQARIDSAVIKASDYVRHVRYPAVNGRMNDVTAALGLTQLAQADALLAQRRESWARYRDVVDGCAWLTPQFVPEGWTHDGWAFAVACDTPERAKALQAAVVAEGGEMPYGCWQLTYREPAFAYLNDSTQGPFQTPGMKHTLCPIAEDLQPRLLQFATNDRISADRNARALARAIEQLS